MNIIQPHQPERVYARPMIPLALSTISGIILGAGLPDVNGWALIAIFLCFGFIVRSLIKKKPIVFSPLLLFLFLGYFSICSYICPKFPVNHITRFMDKQKLEITGIIASRPEEKNRRIRFVLNVHTLKGENRQMDAVGKIRVTVATEKNGPAADLSMGDLVRFSSRIRSLRNFKNPGGFDYKRFMAFKGIWATAYSPESRMVVLEKHSKKSASTVIASARDSISSLIDNIGEKESQTILKALIIGDRSRILPSMRDAFNRAGVGHLLAISGLHIGIVATISFMFFSWLLSYHEPFLWHGWLKKGAAILSVFPVIVYGLLSGMSPSSQRAVIMVLAFLATFLFQRERDGINTLAFAAMIIVIVFPPSVFSVSFQLSFSAVLAIIYGLSKFKYKTRATNEPLWRIKAAGDRLLTFTAVSFFAIMGTLPIVLYYFNQVSVVGLFTNLIFVPLIGFIVVPLGLLAVFIYPVSIYISLFLLKAGDAVLARALVLLHYFSASPFAAVKTVTPSVFEIILYYILLVAVFELIHTSAFIKKRIMCVVFTVLILFGIDACYWLNQRFWHDDLRITVIDVGNGSAALLELPGGACMLVDGGGFSDNRVFDMGQRIIAPFLWQKKIGSVDTLVLSHPNSDHLNGLLYIAEHFNVKDVWSNNERVNTIGYQNFINTLKTKKINTPVFDKIPKTYNINGVEFTILYPPSDFLVKKEKDRWRDTNNNSLVIKVRLGACSFLFPGDIMAKGERELAGIAGDGLKSMVLVAPHHGSRTSSTRKFLNKIQPETVVISAGFKSRYGYPHQSVLNRYQNKGYRVFRTDMQGAVEMISDGKSLTINPTIRVESE